MKRADEVDATADCWPVVKVGSANQLEAVFRAISARDDNSHKLWTDDYLAAFAQASGASLVTLDTKLSGRYPSVQVEQLT